MDFQEIAELPVRVLTNTDENTFWWTTKNFEHRFKHESAKVGQKFFDGNNGDRWEVLGADPEHNRLVVRNLSQDWLGPEIIVWGGPFNE